MISLEYLAGFFDGEGSIMSHHLGGNSRSVIVVVGNTVKEAVEVFQVTFGGSIRKREYKKHPNWKPLWMWEIKDRHAETFLLRIRPYLHLKALQADLAMQMFALTYHRGEYRKNGLSDEDKRIREERFKARECVAVALKAANKRGLN